jgi:hypothetical protein
MLAMLWRLIGRMSIRMMRMRMMRGIGGERRGGGIVIRKQRGMMSRIGLLP